MIYHDWYEGFEEVPPNAGTSPAAKREMARRSEKRGLLATAGSLSLCVAACYLAGGIFGVGALSSDAPASPSSALTPMTQSANEDAAYVMSWGWDDDGANAVSDEHEAYIRELADEYIEAHNGGTHTEETHTEGEEN